MTAWNPELDFDIVELDLNDTANPHIAEAITVLSQEIFEGDTEDFFERTAGHTCLAAIGVESQYEGRVLSVATVDFRADDDRPFRNSAFFDMFATLEEVQGKHGGGYGIGSALTSHVMQLAVEAGFEGVYGIVENDSDGFHVRHGYTSVHQDGFHFMHRRLVA